MPFPGGKIWVNGNHSPDDSVVIDEYIFLQVLVVPVGQCEIQYRHFLKRDIVITENGTIGGSLGKNQDFSDTGGVTRVHGTYVLYFTACVKIGCHINPF